MKIICEREKLLKAINAVVRGVPTRTTMPILEGIYLQTNNNELKLTTYDLELGIEYIIDAEIEEEGNTVVNATMFSEIIRRLPDSQIKIEVNENKLLVIECEGSLYKLSTMNPDEFPELPKIDIENSLETEQVVLRNMIKKTIFAVSNEENRPIFTGCLFEINNNKLNIVAVDGFRMGWVSKVLEKNTEDFKAVIPGKTLNEVNKILTDSFDNIRIGIAKNQGIFEMENCKIVTRLLDGEFFKYESAIPANWETRIRVNKNLLQSGRKNISFRVMDNLKMDTPDNYFDLVTARHTIIEPLQIYKTLKKGGQLVIRGVDKLDCWSLKRTFKRGQAYHDVKPISLIDYEAILDAGFKEVELIPLHVIEYYKTKEDLYALLVKTPILDDFSEESFNEYERKPIEKKTFEKHGKHYNR